MAIKVAGVGDKARGKLHCHGQATSKGLAADSTCLAKAEEKFSSAYAKAEAVVPSTCLTIGDASALEAKLDAFVTDVVSELTPGGGPSECSGSKLRATGDRTDTKLACLAEVADDALPAQRQCSINAEKEFAASFSAAEAGPDCLTSGDAGALEAKVDALVDDVAAELLPGFP